MTSPPAARPRRTVAWCAAVALCVLAEVVCAAGSGIGPAAAAGGAATDPAALPVALHLDVVSPTALTPKSVLIVSGTLRNTSTTTLTGLRVDLRLDPTPITDRRKIATWAAGLPAKEERDGVVQQHLDLPKPLPPGG